MHDLLYTERLRSLQSNHPKEDETDIWPSTCGRFWKEKSPTSHYQFSATYQLVGVDYAAVV